MTTAHRTTVAHRLALSAAPARLAIARAAEEPRAEPAPIREPPTAPIREPPTALIREPPTAPEQVRERPDERMLARCERAAVRASRQNLSAPSTAARRASFVE